MPTQEQHTTNFGLDVPPVAHDEHPPEHVVPAHVDEHAREEMLEGHHPDHGTNFGLILPTETGDETS